MKWILPGAIALFALVFFFRRPPTLPAAITIAPLKAVKGQPVPKSELRLPPESAVTPGITEKCQGIWEKVATTST